MSGRLGWIATLVLLVAAVGCGQSAAPPEQVAALRVFGLADAAPANLDCGSGSTSARTRVVRPPSLDALDALASIVDPEVTGVEPLPETNRAIVDILGILPDGGTALYSVQVERDEAGAWRIGWFAGPGMEWPTPGRRRDEGLTTSGANQR